jgi:hypothetical protein
MTKHQAHRRLTVDQSAQVKRMLAEIGTLSRSIAVTANQAFEVVDGHRDIRTFELRDAVYEICPASLGNIGPQLRELANLYDDIARYCGVEELKAWEPNRR